MNQSIRNRRRIARAGSLAGAALVVSVFASPASAGSISTNQVDYLPGSTAQISVAGFAANELITLQVTHLTTDPPCTCTHMRGWMTTGGVTGGGSTPHAPWSVLADADGNLTTQWLVPASEALGSTLRLTAAAPTTTGETLFTVGCQLGNGRVSSVVAVDGGCVSGPTGNNVQSYDVEQGKTYTVTLTDVTDCANGGTDATIGVLVKNSNIGNQCLTATMTATGIYTFDVTMPTNACFTFPIDYCVIGCDPSTGLKARRGDGACAQVHLRASTFGPGCSNPVEDSDCTAIPPDDDIGTAYCFGDGSISTPCPCALPNTVPSPGAAPGHGCANAFDLDGALLSATGTTTPDTVKFTCTIGPGYVGLAFMLTGNGNIPNGVAGHDGIVCVTRAGAGQTLRFGTHMAGTNGDPVGTWTYPNTVQTAPVSTWLNPVGWTSLPLGNAYYQLYYRHAVPNFCNPSMANYSNGLVIDWQ